MKKAVILIIAVMFCGVICGQPYEGPFGLKKGLALAKLKLIDADVTLYDKDNYTYSMSIVPLPHTDFTTYLVCVSPDSGLCKIIAASGPVETSCYGTELKSKYKSLRDAISRKYGKFNEVDNLMPGSIWDEPEDYMTALLKKERFLVSVWNSVYSSNLCNSIDTIGLQVFALDNESGIITLSYEFDNFDSVKAEIDRKSEESF